VLRRQARPAPGGAAAVASAATQNRLQTVALPAVRGTITDRNGMALTTLDTVKVIADR
jgi:cell division protein FtsI/penicillin-binding protein 2